MSLTERVVPIKIINENLRDDEDGSAANKKSEQQTDKVIDDNEKGEKEKAAEASMSAKASVDESDTKAKKVNRDREEFLFGAKTNDKEENVASTSKDKKDRSDAAATEAASSPPSSSSSSSSSSMQRNGRSEYHRRSEEMTKRTSKTSRTIEESSSSSSLERSAVRRKKPDSTTPEKVRVVPIGLPDGRVLSRDPDETMEIRTEFTNYEHHEFTDSPESPTDPLASPTKSNGVRTKSKSKERIVPIHLESNGEDFMPKFTHLDDIETTPEWSAFNAKNTLKTSEVSAKKENIVPIRMEKSVDKETRSYERTFTRTTSSSSRETSPTPTTPTSSSKPNQGLGQERRQTRERSTSKKRGQHSVRFVDEVDDSDETDLDNRRAKKRSSSLEGGRGNASLSRPPTGGGGRERHRSGPGPRGDSTTKKTLHEIDRDINKIWKELQELDQTSGPAVTSATPVKIRTFTTPKPSTPTPAVLESNHTYRSVSPSPPPTHASTTTVTSSSPFKPRSIFDSPMSSTGSPPTLVSTLTSASPGPTRTYNPRRDHLEPTRPGSITPAYSSSQARRIVTPVTLASETKGPATILQQQQKVSFASPETSSRSTNTFSGSPDDHSQSKSTHNVSNNNNNNNNTKGVVKKAQLASPEMADFESRPPLTFKLAATDKAVQTDSSMTSPKKKKGKQQSKNNCCMT